MKTGMYTTNVIEKLVQGEHRSYFQERSHLVCKFFFKFKNNIEECTFLSILPSLFFYKYTIMPHTAFF
jgi:hypothetical protein